MARAKIWMEEQYLGHPILKYPEGSREEILSAIVKIFHFMWDCRGKRLFVCHLTVYLPEVFEKNGTDIIRGALHSWRSAKLHRNIRCEYLWCREEGDFSNHDRTHYHIFIIVPGKYIQSGYGICNDLNRLLSYRTGKESKRVHINPPEEGSFRWGKKVSEELNNLDDAINWTSYLAKVYTKKAPYRQRTYDYSRGFRNHTPIRMSYSPLEERQFDEYDPCMSEQDWEAWGPEDYDARKELNFDPETGGPYFSEHQEAASPARETQDRLRYGATA